MSHFSMTSRKGVIGVLNRVRFAKSLQENTKS